MIAVAKRFPSLVFRLLVAASVLQPVSTVCCPVAPVILLSIATRSVTSLAIGLLTAAWRVAPLIVLLLSFPSLVVPFGARPSAVAGEGLCDCCRGLHYCYSTRSHMG